MQIRLQQRDILFAFQPGKPSFLGSNYCLLVARNKKKKIEDSFCFTPASNF